MIEEQHLRNVFANGEGVFREDFEKELFGAFVAESRQSNSSLVVGCILHSMNYSHQRGRELFLSGFYVKRAFRGIGVEDVLLEEVKKLAKDQGVMHLATIVTKLDAACRVFEEKKEAHYWYSTTAKLFETWLFHCKDLTPVAELRERVRSDYCIREGNVNDSDDIFRFLEELQITSNLRDYSTNTLEAFRRHRKENMYGSILVEHQSTENSAISCPSQKSIVGCVIFSEMYHFVFGRMNRLQGLFIHPKHQGKGLGKALLRTALKILKERGVSICYTGVAANNLSSQSLFKKIQAVNMSKSEHEMSWVDFFL